MTLLTDGSLAGSKYIFQAYISKTVYLVSAPNDFERLKRLDIDNLQPKTKVTYYKDIWKVMANDFKSPSKSYKFVHIYKAILVFHLKQRKHKQHSRNILLTQN